MKKTIYLGIFIYIGIQIALKCGYKNPPESTYTEATGTLIEDSTDYSIPRHDSLIHKPDTLKNYKGNWVDIQQ